jgi:hypothetical protein
MFRGRSNDLNSEPTMSRNVQCGNHTDEDEQADVWVQRSIAPHQSYIKYWRMEEVHVESHQNPAVFTAVGG